MCFCETVSTACLQIQAPRTDYTTSNSWDTKKLENIWELPAVMNLNSWPQEPLEKRQELGSRLWSQSRLYMLVTLSFLLVVLVDKTIPGTSAFSSIKWCQCYYKMAPSKSASVKEIRCRVCVKPLNIQRSRECLMNGY